ncbi:MAG: ATP-binding protein [Gammaproteobacteria bacterium]|nr:ATP-binding protein [Gammaproteobacteria bacterium]
MLISQIKKFWAARGLQQRLLLTVGLCILFGFSVQVYLSLNTSVHEQRQRHQQEIEELIGVLSTVIAEQAIIGDYATINQLLSSQVKKRQDIKTISWDDGEGGLVSASSGTLQLKAPDWFVALLDLPKYTVQRNIRLAETPYGEIKVLLTNIPASNRLWFQFLKHSLNLLILMISVFLSIVLVLRVNLKTLQRLSLTADQFRHGEHSVRVNAAGARELRTAAHAFNNMANQSEQLLTELSASKQELLEQLNFNMELFDAVPIPLFYKGSDGVYLGVNHAWEVFFGITKYDVVGKTLSHIYPAGSDVLKQHYMADQKLLNKFEENQSYEIVLPDLPGGDRYTLFSKAVYHYTDGQIRGIIGAITDLTKTRESELKAQAALLDKYKAEAANKAKSSFLANMSHEIRTPLTAIIGFSESLLDSGISVKDRMKASETINRNSGHLLQIVNDILDLSKIEANKLELEKTEFYLMDVLAEIHSLAGFSASSKEIDFDISYEFPLPEMLCTDQLRLKQILINLCNNAIKFTDKGGVSLLVRYKADSEMVCFEISDSGIGMTSEQLSKIFNPFVQADDSTTRKYGGTGLGLYVSRQFANCMQGDISVKSQLNKGSCFTLYIKTGDRNNTALLTEVPVMLLSRYTDIKIDEDTKVQGSILLVEDNKDNQRLISMYLNKLGATVSLAQNGKIAVEKAMSNEFDLLLMDMQMPVMDGFTAASQLRQLQYSGPIVALTANAMQEDVDKCLAAGCDQFLAKPIDRDRFNAVIRQYLDVALEKNSADPLYSHLLDEGPEFIDLVLMFIEQLPGRMNCLTEAIYSSDWTLLAKLVHDLKSVSGGYGYLEMSDAAARMEFLLKSKNEQSVTIELEQINTLAERIIASEALLKAEYNL